MKIKFLGAAGTVTGSRFLVQTDGQNILIDCGLYQERDFLGRNWEKFPFNPEQIDVILLTHAHIDHCGYLPKLIKEGYRGKIYCTGPTAQMAKVSLLDSAYVQEADAEQKRKRHEQEGRKGSYPELPLYTVDDVKKVFPHFRRVDYEVPLELGKITATYYDAGHILGAASIQLDYQENGSSKRIVFSGDIGRWKRPLLKDPHVFADADYVVMEATYGDRLHDDDSLSIDKLQQVINQTLQRGGNIIIPSFAIGRTQELLYYFNELLKAKKIPSVPTFVDSPMALEITEIFNSYPEFFDLEAQKILKQHLELFDFPLLKFTPTPNESKAINHMKGPLIVMAGGGMCTGGRIKFHLANNISKPENTILFVGYQALGTLGRTILEKPQHVRILGKNMQVKAAIEKINGFSAHADQGELLRWFGSFKKSLKNVFIVHSEPRAAEALKVKIQHISEAKIVIPTYQEEFIL